MKVVWSEQARQEWAAQYRYYFERNPDAARRLRQTVMDGVRRLREYPKIGRPGHIEGTRELSIAGTSYVAVYEITGDRIDILHVYHGRQDWQH